MNELIILPAVRATLSNAGKFIVTQKYLEGTAVIARHWPGPVTTLVRMADRQSTDFDHIEVDTERFGSGIEERPDTDAGVMTRMKKAAAVLGFLDRKNARLAPLCKAVGLPLIYVAEYSPKTEAQIIDAGTRNPLLRVRRKLWLRRTDKIRCKAASLASGIQCSGTPSFKYYSAFQSNPMLFFDNRIEAVDMLTEEACRAKTEGVLSNRPLRLIYGGRFVPMKGVMDLPDVAAELKSAGVAFQLDICGDGPLKPELVRKIAALGLDDVVQLREPVDFRTSWIRVLKDEADLFICCHQQGDPSSSYPEAMSCGVPIVGYDNEAFRGVVEHSKVGWQTPAGQPRAMADQIITLTADRQQIADAALKGLDFARETVFETTFKARADHLISAARML